MVAFDLKADEAGDTAGQLWIIVNHDGHQLAMADMQDDASAGDDFVLVPLSTFAIGAKLSRSPMVPISSGIPLGWICTTCVRQAMIRARGSAKKAGRCTGSRLS